MQFLLPLLFTLISCSAFAQTGKGINDPEVSALLKQVSDKYKSYKNVSAAFKLLIQKPKVKPTDDERKLTDTLAGNAIIEGAKFNVQMNGQQTFCDGKNIWTYMSKDKEVQVNFYTDDNDVFSPARIFTVYQDGFNYQVKEKKNINGKNITVIEMVPVKSASYFKMDVTIDASSDQILESKIYERNGTRYIYKLAKQTFNVATSTDTFSFDPRKNPGVKVTDLR